MSEEIQKPGDGSIGSSRRVGTWSSGREQALSDGGNNEGILVGENRGIIVTGVNNQVHDNQTIIVQGDANVGHDLFASSPPGKSGERKPQ